MPSSALATQHSIGKAVKATIQSGSGVRFDIAQSTRIQTAPREGNTHRIARIRNLVLGVSGEDSVGSKNSFSVL